MKKILGLGILNIILTISVYTQHNMMQQYHHKYVTNEAWEVVIAQHQGVLGSQMDYAMGVWHDNGINGGSGYSNDWIWGKIMTGVWREDETDVVYRHGWPYTSITHFWDMEGCGVPNDCRFWYLGYGYANSYMKSQSYWNGDVGGNGFVIIGPYQTTNGYGRLLLKYNNLPNVYKYDQIWVTSFSNSSGWFPVNPPVLLRTYLETRGYSYENTIRPKIRNICWETVGRICHLLEDNSVPAHTHNDLHVSSDYYEDIYLPIYYSWRGSEHALAQGGMININNKVYPIRYAMITANQIADRFPSDDEDGDCCYSSYGPDNEAQVISTYYQAINAITPYIGIGHFHNNPPGNLMPTILNYSYVYSMRSVAGFLDYVFNQFNIPSGEIPPIISHYTQTPGVLCRGSEAEVLCYLLQGSGNITYTWQAYDIPPGVSVSYYYASAQLTYSGADVPEKGKNFMMPVPNFKLVCTATNSTGSSTKDFYPYHSNNCGGGGCPWLLVNNNDSGCYVYDNNILHRSEFPENNGIDITDRYLLKVKPDAIENYISIIIKETETETDFINRVSLIAVDHPIGTKIGVTEANDIVMYDSNTVQSTDDATLNGNRNITNLIQYYYTGEKVVRGDGGDSIYAHYGLTGQLAAIRNMNNKYKRFMIGDNNTGDSLALITELGDNDLITPIVNKDWAGNVRIYTSTSMVQKWFARREEMSDVIIPFAGLIERVDHIDVKWNQDYQVKHFSVVPIMYSGFTTNLLQMVDARDNNNNDEYYSSVLVNDTLYATVNSSKIIKYSFLIPADPVPGMQRDYVLEISGYYTNVTDNVINNPLYNNPTSNILPTKYMLHQNYPNPFNPTTKIKYEIPKNSFVKITIYDVLGRQIAQLVNEFVLSGIHEVEFNAKNLASGLYIYKLEAGDYIDTKKMLLIK